MTGSRATAILILPIYTILTAIARPLRGATWLQRGCSAARTIITITVAGARGGRAGHWSGGAGGGSWCCDRRCRLFGHAHQICVNRDAGWGAAGWRLGTAHLKHHFHVVGGAAPTYPSMQVIFGGGG